MSSQLPCPLITLTTDFGIDSPYVAQMKGVILSRNPGVQIVDICHGIAPQDVRGAAILLADVCHHFPARTIHIAVVDPGVGTDRRVVFAQIDNQRFVAPDNGLLTLVAQRAAHVELIAVTNRTYLLSQVSPTFHGRDIFAPVAAHLSLGLSPKRLGEPLTSLVTLPIPEPILAADRIVGQVIQIDAFGNLITNIAAEHLHTVARQESVSVACGSAKTTGLVLTYGNRSPGSLIALIGSSGRLEIAVVNGSAASNLSAKVDDPVVVAW